MTLLVVVGLAAAGAILHRPLLGTGWMFQVLRLPGNLLHELAHAVALLACGFTVVGFSVALFDPAGRGEVRPGPPWTRFASVWAASFLSPIAPVFVGVPTLALLFHLSGAPGLPTALEAVGPTLRAMPWTHATFWVAMLLAVPVSAEMAPSDVDLRAWRTPGLIAAAVVAAAILLAEWWVPGAAEHVFRRLDTALARPVAQAVSLVAWASVVWIPVGWAVARVTAR